jgi:hypothetical protein
MNKPQDIATTEVSKRVRQVHEVFAVQSLQVNVIGTSGNVNQETFGNIPAIEKEGFTATQPVRPLPIRTYTH